MALYPASIARCQHLKVNGVQCGSPALNETTFCYYHIRYHSQALEKIENSHEFSLGFPTLEDANSIQVSLAKVMQRLVGQEIDFNPRRSCSMLCRLRPSISGKPRSNRNFLPRLSLIAPVSGVAPSVRPPGPWSKGVNMTSSSSRIQASPSQPRRSLCLNTHSKCRFRLTAARLKVTRFKETWF
jgi:hypothetical protein